MTLGIDRVQVLKQESSALGGDSLDSVDFPTPISPQEDVIESAGLFLQDATNRDENVYLARNGNDLVFRDVSNPTETTLTSILAGTGKGLLEVSGAYVYVDDGDIVTKL